MALIKCSECGKDISDKAEACPSCGNPIRNKVIDVEIEKPLQIERTNKRWKKKRLWAIGFLIVGFFMLGRSDTINFGILLFLIAFAFMIISRIGAWWTNG